MWIRRENLFEYYGLCAIKGSFRDALYFLPLMVIATRNFWNGFGVNLPAIDTAFLVSSLTFGLEHIVHLFDGSGMTLVTNFCQVLGALGVGFVFAAVFYTTGSLLPCIITHSLYDTFSAFANETGLTDRFRIATSIIIVIIAGLYGLYLLKMKRKSKPIYESDDYSLPEVPCSDR